MLNEDVKRFQQIMEYIQVGDSLVEDDKEPDVDPNGGDSQSNGPAPDFGGMQGGPDAMGGAPGAMGGPEQGGEMGDPNAMGGAPDAMGGPDAGADPMQGGEAQEGPEGFDPQVGGDEPSMDLGGEDQPGPDDNVVDIDDLTSAQDETKEEIAGLNANFDKLLGVVDKFLTALDKNDEKISQLKQELEKRNPTPIEKLDLRSVNDSFPYNVKPTDYWKDKEETSNYRVGGDVNNTPEQYELHQSDIDNATDWKAISDSLDDNEYISNLTKLLNF